MDLLLKGLAVALIAGSLSLTLERTEPTFSMLVGIAAVLCILLIGAALLEPLRSFLDRLLRFGGASGVYTTPLLKCLCAAVVTRIGAALCRDAKQSGPASAVELIGTMAVLCAALPLFEMLLSTLEGMV